MTEDEAKLYVKDMMGGAAPRSSMLHAKAREVWRAVCKDG